MKKFLYSILSLCLLGFGYSADAQSFTTEHDTVTLTVYKSLEAHNNITNTTSADIKIDWKVKDTDFPTPWKDALGICDNFSCRDNAGNQLFNNTVFTSDVYKPSVLGDFHLLLSHYDVATIAPGTYYLTVNLKESGATYEKDITFIINKWTTGISNINSANDNIVLYPNPARSELNVNFENTSNVKTIAIYNLVGKQISTYRVSGKSAKLDIEKIPSGIYFVRLADNTGRVITTRRFTHQ